MMEFNDVRQALIGVLEQANDNGVLVLEGPKPGPTISICALTHGNEISGIVTAAQILAELRTGELELTRGRLQILLANYEILHEAAGFEQLKRHRGLDLNRIWGAERQPLAAGLPGSQEFAVRDRLLPAVLASDCLIDLHSTSMPSTPIGILLSDSGATRDAVINQLDVPYVLLNISDHLNGTSMIDRHHQGQESAASSGHPRFSLVIEAGQHFDFGTIQTNVANVRRLLRDAGILRGSSEPVPTPALRLDVYRVGLAQAADHDVDWVYADVPAGFDALPDGTHVCNLHGEAIHAQGDSFVVMPQLRSANAGQELFYLARAGTNASR